MLTHEEMIGLQAEKHDLIDTQNFQSKEEFVLHLIHTFAYHQASRLSENKKVLDLGCNTGYGSEILSRNVSKVVGVDVSKNAISSAKNQFGQLGIQFLQIDGKKLPFEDNEFDMIVSCQVLEHIVDYGVFINELKRVLSPNGIVFFTTPNALIRLYPGMKPWNKFHVREFAYFELQSLLIPFFSNVQVWGLNAIEPLYSVEANRLDRARKEAANSQGIALAHSNRRNNIKSIIKKVLPYSIIKMLKKRVHVSSSAKVVSDEDFYLQFGIDDFSYRTNKMETALDLAAVCSDSAGSIEEAHKRWHTN